MPGEISRSYGGPVDDVGLPQAVTCDAIRRICEQDKKSYAVLICVNRANNTTQFATWGKSPEDKCDASDLADQLSKGLCGSLEPVEVYESFKLEAARNKARVEQLEDVLRRAKQFIMNGIEVGYIARPELGTTEHATMVAVQQAVRDLG